MIAGASLLMGGYLGANRFRLERSTFYFAAGVAIMLLALVSPLDVLADDYLFSAHMVQHILLVFVAPPLFVLGVSPALTRRILRWRPAALVESILRRPGVAWPLAIGTLWIWHLPSLYDLTLADERVHILEHLTFLVTGTILWWPILTPIAGHRMPALLAVAYLALAATANALLGIIFAFSTTPFYAGYAHPHDELGALAMIRERWGLSTISDQRLGGAIMWVLGSVIFVTAILATLLRWYQEEEARHP